MERVGKERTEIARRVNNYGASLAQQRPDRFGYFTTLPLPDVDSARKEIDRAYSQLKVDGVILHSNYDGIYLADPAFEPVWEELNRRSAVVFLHPTTPKGVKVLPGVPGPLEDYPADTTRAALARKIRDFRTRKASPMVQIRCSRGFDTKKEAFACPNIPRQSVCSSQIFLIGPLSRSLINGRAVPMAERFCCRLPSDG